MALVIEISQKSSRERFAQVINEDGSMGDRFDIIEISKINKKIFNVLKKKNHGERVEIEFSDLPRTLQTKLSKTSTLPKQTTPPLQHLASEQPAPQGKEPIQQERNPQQQDHGQNPQGKRGHGQNQRTVPFTGELIGVSDALITRYPGSRYTQPNNGNKKEFVEYAPDLRAGLGKDPDINHNPYNFAAFQNSEPWPSPDNPKDNDDPRYHQIFRQERHSGKIIVRLTAQTPIFIPHTQHNEVDSATERMKMDGTFFKCQHLDGIEKFAIPGSSFKGVVRSLFESLTNSRCGVTNNELFKDPPLYRRRSAELYIIKMPPELDKNDPIKCRRGGKVWKCKCVYLDNANQIVGKTKVISQDAVNKAIAKKATGKKIDLEQGDVDIVDWKANLFQVDLTNYEHGNRTKIAFKLDEKSKTDIILPDKVVNAFLSMKGHVHLKEHPKYVKEFGEGSHYTDPESLNYEAQEQEMFKLEKGTLLYAITENNQIKCFGKNVHFLWPALSSDLSKGKPLELLGKFRQRSEEERKLEGSDLAESVFGFIGNERKGSKSYKGRVRFTPLWCHHIDPSRVKIDAITLMPLMSPPGSKLKSRPLYLKGDKNGISADYGDAAPQLKGRKFYWHQMVPDGQESIAHVHNAKHLEAETREKVSENLKQEPICPLPVGTTFSGEVHFSNLSDIELGALLASLDPNLIFTDDKTQANSRTQYGLKIGKGKPRGLGSVTSKLTLELLPANRYQSWEPVTTEGNDGKNETYVQAYRDWAVKQGKKESWDELEFALDLKNLLAIPTKASVKVYPPKFDMYNWMPDFNNAQGDPQGGKERRSKAMEQAREIKIP